MTTEVTEKPKEDESVERKFNRKEVIHLGFQSKTRGEAAFNAISYIGFGYFVVTAASVLATWGLRDLGPVAKGFEKWVSKPVSKALHIDTTVMNILTLFTGGTIASVLPVKWLEDRKPQAVKKLDYMLYSEDQFYNDPKIKAAHKELDELPKQTWTTVFSSRVVAFAATFGVFFAMGSNKSPLAKAIENTSFAKKFGKSLDEMSIKAGRGLDRILSKNNDKIVERIEQAIVENKKRMAPELGKDALGGMEVLRDKVDANGKILASGDRIPSRVYSYIGLDAFYTIFTSASLWVSTRVLGAVMGKTAKPQPEAAAVTEYHPRAITSRKRVSEQAQETLSASPPTTVTAPVRIERVAEPGHTAELSA